MSIQPIKQRALKAVRGFHSDEAGNETIQTVMIVALSAIILIAIKKIWDTTEGGVTDLLGQLFSLVF